MNGKRNDLLTERRDVIVTLFGIAQARRRNGGESACRTEKLR